MTVGPRWQLAAVVAALVIGGLAGAALTQDDDSDDRLRVNGSDVAQAVWEARPQPSAAPRCTPRTADGIGAWRCSIRYAGVEAAPAAPTPSGVPKPPTAGGGPGVESADVIVTDRGDVNGELGGRRFESCCIRVR